LTKPGSESVKLPQSILEGAMASAKSVLEKMITAMNRGGDASKRAILRAKDIDRFVKPTPKKARAMKKSPIALRAYVSSKAAKKPRKKMIKKKKANR
jgi:hypothetical protein